METNTGRKSELCSEGYALLFRIHCNESTNETDGKDKFMQMRDVTYKQG